MRPLRFLSVFLFFFMYIFTSAQAQVDPEKITSIVRKALTFDVTEEVHSEFWQYFGDLDSLSENKKSEIQDIKESLILSQNWQFAFWDSALATLQNQRITKSPEYYKYYEILSKQSVNDKSLKSAENVLKSILRKEYIELPPSFLEILGSQERGIVLNEDAITQIRDNLAVNFDRLEDLINFKKVFSSTPNLFSFLPVDILFSVFASVFGFNLMPIFTITFFSFAIFSISKTSL